MWVLFLFIVVFHVIRSRRRNEQVLHSNAEIEAKSLLDRIRARSFGQVLKTDPQTRAWLDGVRRSLAVGHVVKNGSAKLPDNGADRNSAE